MGLFNNYRTGIRSYREAHRFIVKHKLWLYVFLPGMINAGVIVMIMLSGWPVITSVNEWLLDLLGLSGNPEGFLKFLATAMQVILKIIFYILIFLLYSMIYRYIILIILSPFLALLSEKTEKLLTGAEYPFRFGQFLHDVFRGIGIAIRNMLLELMFMIVLFFLSYIPVIGYICPVIMFLITCFYYGFSMMDYTNERHRLSARKSVRFIRKNRGFAIANGMVFYLLFFFVPLIGFVVAPAYAVVAATLGIHKINEVQGGGMNRQPFLQKEQNTSTELKLKT